jgi:hypothetical protein
MTGFLLGGMLENGLEGKAGATLLGMIRFPAQPAGQ